MIPQPTTCHIVISRSLEAERGYRHALRVRRRFETVDPRRSRLVRNEGRHWGLGQGSVVSWRKLRDKRAGAVPAVVAGSRRTSVWLSVEVKGGLG